MKGSIRLISFLSTKSSAWNPLTSAANVAANCDGSNLVIGPTPDRPARSAAHVGPTPIPSGVTAPSPVTTTLLMLPLPVYETPPGRPSRDAKPRPGLPGSKGAGRISRRGAGRPFPRSARPGRLLGVRFDVLDHVLDRLDL